ncbi:fatty acid desaturase [uncultured Gimesia sp.]|uniref:acyl-CoA desaturase n=1 Tax=uncultured Gimesia sp. TaxID=1678688 RepID=UPI0030D942CB|tara:strand:- start:55028 stop:55999 length:972 start_codon:yes stop_codon:yes gene_type:complete
MNSQQTAAPHVETDNLTSEEPTETAPANADSRVDWAVIGWIAVIHLGLLAAPFYFTWTGLITCLILGWLTGGIGICMGYHRLLTHGSFQTYPFMFRLIGLIGLLAGQGPPIQWVANHRKHHLHSDQPGDPHSPRDGRWWSHIMWLIPYHSTEDIQATHERFAPDLLKDPFMRFLQRTFLLWHIGMGAILYGIGYWLGGSEIAISMVVYGMFVRLFYVLHATWFVNSATHIWGYRNYETTDDSRNLWWVALLTYGEGWHNNHHKYQRMAKNGHKWWELDMTYGVILVLEKLGLAWKVVKTIPPNDKESSVKQPNFAKQQQTAQR